MRKTAYSTMLMAVLALLFLPTVGCGQKPKLPPTHPVRGKVIFPGGKPVSGGGVQFQSQADTRVSAVGDIQPDGTFTLSSFIAGDRAPGAVAGPHCVLITPPLDANRVEAFPPTTLAELLVVKPGENEFTLTVGDQRGR